MRTFAALIVWLCAGLGVGVATGASAQSDLNLGVPETGAVRSPVLTVDPDQLFEGSLFGQRVMEQVRAETEALATENRRIEAALTAEEQTLTEQRATMAVEEFRAAADAFDERVQGIRRAQDAKERALDRLQVEGRDQFLVAAQPILGRLMLERGAAVMLDRRSVFLGFGAIDVTEAAIAAIDAELGDGSALTSPEMVRDPLTLPDPDGDPEGSE